MEELDKTPYDSPLKNKEMPPSKNFFQKLMEKKLKVEVESKI